MLVRGGRRSRPERPAPQRGPNRPFLDFWQGFRARRPSDGFAPGAAVGAQLGPVDQQKSLQMGVHPAKTDFQVSI